MTTLVSVLVLTYNSEAVIERCIEAVHAQTYPNIELICVDNASDDHTAARLSELDRIDVLVINEENIGFARGMNQALALAAGHVVIFLNADCFLSQDFVEVAVGLVESGADLLGATVLRLAAPTAEIDEDGQYQLDGAVLGVDATLRVRHLRQRETLQETFKTNGACPVVRRSLLDRLAEEYGVEAFDPVFDTYAEDIDLAFRAAAAGAASFCSSDLVSWHVRSHSAKGERVFEKRGRLRTNVVAGRHLNCWRHLPLARACLVSLVLACQDMGLALRCAILGDRSGFRDVGVAWVRCLAQRQALRAFRKSHRTWQRIEVSRMPGPPRNSMVVAVHDGRPRLSSAS